MNIINYLPGMLGFIVAAFIIGLIVRVASEGANLKTALLTPLRFLIIPIAIAIVIYGLHKGKRELIFHAKQSDELTDDSIASLERILKSKRSLIWLMLKFCVAMYRPLLDAFIRASVKFEHKKAEDKARQSLKLRKYQKRPKEDEEKFFPYFLRDSDVKQHLFHV